MIAIAAGRVIFADVPYHKLPNCFGHLSWRALRHLSNYAAVNIVENFIMVFSLFLPYLLSFIFR